MQVKQDGVIDAHFQLAIYHTAGLDIGEFYWFTYFNEA